MCTGIVCDVVREFEIFAVLLAVHRANRNLVERIPNVFLITRNEGENSVSIKFTKTSWGSAVPGISNFTTGAVAIAGSGVSLLGRSIGHVNIFRTSFHSCKAANDAENVEANTSRPDTKERTIIAMTTIISWQWGSQPLSRRRNHDWGSVKGSCFPGRSDKW